MKQDDNNTSGDSFIGNTVFLFLARFFPTLATLLVMIYFSHYLSLDMYGAYNNFWVRLMLISTIAGLGIQNFLVTYSPATVASLIKSLTPRHYSLFLIWVMALGIAFAWLMHGSMLVWLPFCFLLVYVLTTIVEAVLMVFKNRQVLIWTNLAYCIIFCWLHYIFVLQETMSMYSLFTYLLLLSVGKFLVYFYAYTKDIAGQPVAEITDMQKIRNLWGHMAFYDVSQMVFKWIDKFVLGLILSAGVFAIYFNGSVDIPFLPLLLGAVGSSGLMQLSIDNNKEAPIIILNKTGRILSAIVFPVFFFFVLFRYEFIELMFSVDYLEAVPIFLMSIMVLPLRAYKFTTILQHKHLGRIINTGAVVDLIIACGLAYPLYKMMGLPGVALSFVISTYIQSYYYLHHTAKVLGVSVFKLIPAVNWMIKLIVFATIFIIYRYLLPQSLTKEIILISGIAFTLVVVLIAFITELKAVKRIYGNPQAQV